MIGNVITDEGVILVASIVLTILSGVTIFVIGQFILKLILDPIVAFKTALGELSAFFLREQAKITNATATEEIQLEIQRLTSSILSHRHTIPFYRFFAFFLRLPYNKRLIEGCHALNSISYHVNQNIPYTGKNNRYHEIREKMGIISTNLKVRVNYEKL